MGCPIESDLVEVARCRPFFKVKGVLHGDLQRQVAAGENIRMPGTKEQKDVRAPASDSLYAA